ncbi:Fe-S protein assembly co-chaperone HscB [Pedobacter montanisoli]|uniref:Fe-S protein assembly co-chaperone HscB n=1 Tax=Pedobacter montanisoli TaxID=2923277 RepID=A0ABS9ZZU9_9SPHI|nr:Fe-S protein assembly co-chaperone HscB [Pedobacter montanisoli]MCJ0743823.1 Fe-S protein assembly co-chaperone HscB [Pedobacter montanisoli]
MMNYFEFYGLPLSFFPDQVMVKQQFYALSKKYHPDFYINKSEAEQEGALELSTLNNKAFQVLKDPKKTLKYILELKNLIAEGDHYTLPQSFLMEMMDLNEAIMELQFDADPQKLAEVNAQLQSMKQRLSDELETYTRGFESVSADQQDASLLKIKDIYYRNKYLQRIEERLAK